MGNYLSQLERLIVTFPMHLSVINGCNCTTKYRPQQCDSPFCYLRKTEINDYEVMAITSKI